MQNPCHSARHGHHRWRAVPDRHVPWHLPWCPEDGCPGCAEHPPGCAGCEPCPERHCAVCRWRHLARRTVCVRCVAGTRDDLETIGQRLAEAPALVDGWPTSTALEPVAAGRSDETPLPVGDLGVMLADGSRGHSEDGQTWRGDDPMPVGWLLASWADDWRVRFGGGDVTTPLAYLTRRIDRAADRHPAFGDFASEIRATRRELDARAGMADREHTGVPCPYCGDTLLRPDDDPDACPPVWVPPLDTPGGTIPGYHRPCDHTGPGHDQGGLRDHWRCRNRDCARRYEVEKYRFAIWQAWHDRQSAVRDSEPSEDPTPTGGTPAAR